MGHGRFVLLAATLASLIVLPPARNFRQTDITSYSRTNKTVNREALVNSSGVRDMMVVMETTNTSEKTGIQEIPIDLELANISVHFSDLSGSVYSMDWRYLAYIWDRDTTWDDILQHAAQNTNEVMLSSSAKGTLQQQLKGNNITTIFHTIPKTASSTLRGACMETQYDSCNLKRKPEKMKWPEGYQTLKRLMQLFEECPDTRHFCVRGMPRRPFISRNFKDFYNTRSFLHLFPFRNYDEWATSALHQISYRDGEEGCEKEDELLDECLPHQYELDFGKYTKSIMAEFVWQIRRVQKRSGRSNVNAHHHILLHGFERLDDTLTWLNASFGVPLLPGTGKKLNSDRPKESCKNEESMMKKFHNCFSDELAGLYLIDPRKKMQKLS